MPTRSEIDQLDTSTLTTRSTSLTADAETVRDQADELARAIEALHTAWLGPTGLGVTGELENDRLRVLKVADALDDLAEAYSNGATRLSGARQVVRGRIADAEGDDYEVSDDWVVSDTRSYGAGTPITQIDHRQSLLITHADDIGAGVREFDTADREVALTISNLREELDADAQDALLREDYVPPTDLTTLSDAERRAVLADPDFWDWAERHQHDAKEILDQAYDAGLIPATDVRYREFTRDFWIDQAMERAGIDPSQWRPELGTSANADIISKVYEYYGQLYLDRPELQWAGMANMIGPSFAGGFFDLEMFREIAGKVPTGVGPAGPYVDVLANLTEEEIRWYETKFLEMQREIFNDQAGMHEAYLLGGVEEIQRMKDLGLLDASTRDAWRDIDQGVRTGDDSLVAQGNTELLRREQFTIIADDYDEMRSRPVTGEAVTWGMTLVGAPSIPDAQTYPEVFPLVVETPKVEIPWWAGPIKVPGFDIPVIQGTTITTPFPDGNIADQDQRWNLIAQDTLPAYQELLATDPERAREIIGSDFNTRLQEQRLLARAPEIINDLLDWEVELR